MVAGTLDSEAKPRATEIAELGGLRDEGIQKIHALGAEVCELSEQDESALRDRLQRQDPSRQQSSSELTAAA
jgi:hypothetical protein